MSESQIVKKGDVVLHTLSTLHFVCENTHHERWMNANPYYVLTDKKPSELINYANR